MKHIKVFAPGTVANLGCGFDIMGLALDGVGDRIEVAAEAGASGLAIRNESGKRLPENPEDNVITPAVAAMLEAYGKPVRVEVTILEKIAPGSGIGSSAASSAAAVYGLNELLGRPFAAERLVEFAMMGEALIGGTPHADNVGPALLGGVVLIRGYGPLDIIRLPVPDDFFYAVAHPDIVVGTKEAREVLPREIPMAHAVTQWGNVGGLFAGLALGDVALIGRSMHDDEEPLRRAGNRLQHLCGPRVELRGANRRLRKDENHEILQHERQSTCTALFSARSRRGGAGARRGTVRPRTYSAG